MDPGNDLHLADEIVALSLRLHNTLTGRGETIASAESLTGGLLADLLSGSPGASSTYRGGVVAYATDVKESMLGVRPETLERDGAVSASCAEEMALGIRDRLDADWAVSTTGVAGPAPQEDKPVGLVYVCVAGPGENSVHELRLSGERSEIRHATCHAALEAIMSAIESTQSPGARAVTGTPDTADA
jgi:nicotinamide-nucleotide amidase